MDHGLANDDDAKVLDTARLASMVGLLAVAASLVTMCGGCVMLPVALGAGLGAIYLGRQAMAGSDAELVHAHAKHGLANGVMASIWAMILIGGALAYIGMYVGILLFLIAIEMF